MSISDNEFQVEADDLRIAISVYDSNLEPLLLPDLFTDGKGHFHGTRPEKKLRQRLSQVGDFAIIGHLGPTSNWKN